MRVHEMNPWKVIGTRNRPVTMSSQHQLLHFGTENRDFEGSFDPPPDPPGTGSEQI